MSKKEYMKSGQIKEGQALHYDGVGFFVSNIKSINDFKVNKWMLKHGFKWELDQVNKGLWARKGNTFTQKQARHMYDAFKKPWWRFW